MESALERPKEEGDVRKGAEIIRLPIKESIDAELKRLEREVAEAFKRLIDANGKDEPASARVFAIGAKLNRAKSDEERREFTAQLDATNQRRYKIWDEIREARVQYAKAKAAYEAAKEKLEAEPVKFPKAA